MKLIPIEGPLAYLDIITNDKRLLTPDNLVIPSQPVPVLSLAGMECTGQIDRFQLWGDVLWAYGTCDLGRFSRVHASLAVNGESRTYCGVLIWDEWTPMSVALHDAPASPWSGHATYLEASK